MHFKVEEEIPYFYATFLLMLLRNMKIISESEYCYWQNRFDDISYWDQCEWL